MQKTNLTLWLLLLGGPVLCAQTPLELGSKTDFYVAPGSGKLMTRDEYVSRYRSDNSFQASNAVEVSVMHFDDTAIVADQRKKASPKEKPKTFDSGFGTFSAADMAQIRKTLAKVIYVDHWMSDSDVAVFEATLDKLDELLRQNRAAIQKLQ